MSKILVLFALFACSLSLIACEEESGSTSEGDGGSNAEVTPEPTEGPATIGTLVEVGDLDLTVLSAEAVDTSQYNQFNEANYQLRIKATNARGDADEEYSINMLAFKLVDSAGVAHDPSLGCAGCPDSMGGAVSVVKDGTFEGNVYFELPEGQSVVELRYQAPFSTNKATISLQ